MPLDAIAFNLRGRRYHLRDSTSPCNTGRPGTHKPNYSQLAAIQACDLEHNEITKK